MIPTMPPPVPITVMTQNTSGARINEGEVKAFAKRKADMVLESKVDAFSFEEVTDDQYLSIRARLAPKGYRVYYSPMRPETDTGLVVGVKTKAATTKVVHYLPTPSYGVDDRATDVRRLLCLKTEIKGYPVTVCGTHYTPLNPDRGLQAAETQRYLADKGPSVLMGDFNMAADRDEMQAFSELYPDPGMNYPKRGVTAYSKPNKVWQCIDSVYWTGTMEDRDTLDTEDSDHYRVRASGMLGDFDTPGE